MNPKRKASADIFRPKRALGQNFLVSPHAVTKIVTACHPRPEDTILEIGPGKGILTKALAPRVKKIYAIEKDDYLAKQLQEVFRETNVEIIHADVLKHPFATLPQGLKGVGNLPYNIATPILEKIFEYRHLFSVFYMTVQLEYGNRMAAAPHSKEYGALSCFVQYYAHVRKLFQIPAGAFRPAPKVTSCFLELALKSVLTPEAEDEQLLFHVIRTCFQQRRKTLENALSARWGKDTIRPILQDLKIDPKARAENLSLEDYVSLSNRVNQMPASGLPNRKTSGG